MTKKVEKPSQEPIGVLGYCRNIRKLGFKMKKKLSLLWFIIGFGNGWRIIASLSVSEAIILASSFFVIPSEYSFMKRDGTSFYFGLALMTVLGCIAAVIVNQTPGLLALRGLAATSILACSIPFGHLMIRKHPSGFKWMFVGLSMTLLVRTLMNGSSFVNDPLYWKSRVNSWGLLPIIGWYLNVPATYRIGCPLLVALFSLTKTVSGRGTALGAIFFAVIAFIGGHTRKGMGRLSRNFWRYFLYGLLSIFCLHSVYRIAAIKGWMGEAATRKYEIQTQGSSSIGRLLLGGRGESFIGLLACRDKPIVGWGPWIMDKGFRYREEFVTKYGTEMDVEAFYRKRESSVQQQQMKKVMGRSLIACHSHVTEFWLWYGIFGLLFWVYYAFVLIRYYKDDCFVVPQWFGWLACSIPGLLWDVVFNPFSSRIVLPMAAVGCLMARAVRRGQFVLPPEMIAEIGRKERWK